MCEREDRISDPTGILDPSAYASDSSRHAQESSRVEIDPTGLSVYMRKSWPGQKGALTIEKE